VRDNGGGQLGKYEFEGIKNHAQMVALYTDWYNFVKPDEKHRKSPTMAAGISDWLWSMEDIAALVGVAALAPGKRRPQKTRVAQGGSNDGD
jgi:hypothetical protein